MKKLVYSAVALFMAIGFAVSTSSCKNGGDEDSTKMVKASLEDYKANLKSKTDSLSYAVGISNGQGLDQYLESLGYDSICIQQFKQGFADAMSNMKEKKNAAYFTGAAVANQIYDGLIRQMNYQLSGNDSTEVLSVKSVSAGILDGLSGEVKMTVEEAYQVQQRIGQELQKEMAEKQYGDNKKKGELYLAKNKKAEGVVTLPSGVQYKVITAGSGKKPTEENTVKLHYEGKLIDGTVFDSSYERGEPITARANQFVPGFNEALANMPAGSKWEVVIPQELAYAEQQRGNIPPFSTLIFTVELLSVN